MWEIVSFKNYAENEAGRLVPALFVFWKVLYEVKVNGQHLSSNIFGSPRLGHTKGSYKISDCLSRDMLNFNF